MIESHYRTSMQLFSHPKKEIFIYVPPILFTKSKHKAYLGRTPKVWRVFKVEPSDRIMNEMTRLGFTKYEVLTYWTLLVNGPSTAREISEESGIPYNRVYDTVTSLKARGFVTEVEGTPRVYAAFSPSIAFMRLKRDIDELRKLFEEELAKSRRRGREKPAIWRTTDIDEAIEMVRESIEGSEYEIILVAPEKFLERIQDDLEKALRDGVTLSLYTGGNASLNGLRGKGNLFIRRFHRLNHFIGMFDGKEVIDIQNIGLRPRNPPSFKATYPEIIFAQYAFVREAFQESELLIEDVNRKHDVRFFTTFHAVDLIRRHLPEGRVYAEVVGRNLSTGELETLSGEVVGYTVVLEEGIDNFDLKVNGKIVKVGGMFAVLEEYESTRIRLILD